MINHSIIITFQYRPMNFLRNVVIEHVHSRVGQRIPSFCLYLNHNPSASSWSSILRYLNLNESQARYHSLWSWCEKLKFHEHSMIAKGAQGSILLNYFCCNWTAVKLKQDFDELCGMFSEFLSGHIWACY